MPPLLVALQTPYRRRGKRFTSHQTGRPATITVAANPNAPMNCCLCFRRYFYLPPLQSYSTFVNLTALCQIMMKKHTSIFYFWSSGFKNVHTACEGRTHKETHRKSQAATDHVYSERKNYNSILRSMWRSTLRQRSSSDFQLPLRNIDPNLNPTLSLGFFGWLGPELWLVSTLEVLLYRWPLYSHLQKLCLHEDTVTGYNFQTSSLNG